MVNNNGIESPPHSEEEAILRHTKFFQEMYWREIDRKDKIHSHLALPITIITIFCGVTMHYWKTFVGYQSSILLLASVILSGSILVAIYFLARLIISIPSKALPYSGEIEQYIKEVYGYYMAKDAINVGFTTGDIESYLNKGYITAASENAWNNDRLSAWLHGVRICIVFSCIGVIIGFIPFLMTPSDKVQKIEIVNKGGTLYAATEQSTTPEATSTTATTTTATETSTTAIKNNKRGENSSETPKEVK